MTKPIITISNSETGEVVEREMNEQEFAVYETDRIEHNKEKAERAKAEADKASAKTSTQAKLAALGLTEEEVASILG